MMISTIIIISLVMIIIGLFIYFRRKIKRYTEFFDKLTNVLEGGTMLRNGFIDKNHYISSLGRIITVPSSYDTSYRMLIEVKELERTFNNKSKIEVVSISLPDSNYYRNDSTNLKISVSKTYDGWYASDKIEWVQKIDQRTEVINNILTDIN